MPALVRIAAVAVAGVTLYFAGIVNSIVINEPSRGGALAVALAVGAALAMLVAALRGRGDEPFAGTSRTAVRVIWLLVSICALVGLAWLFGVPRQRGFDWTPYHNDAIAINECAAKTILAGGRPYSDVDLFSCYGERRLGPDRTTPLRRGLFADVPVYPSDDELDAAWAERSRGRGENVEFVWRPSYPALSYFPLLPWVAVGWDTNLLYLLCLLAAMALVLSRARPDLRPFVTVGLLGSVAPIAFTVGGSGDLLYALPLVAAWTWRERGWSAVAFGLSAAAKQLAWFFAPYLFMQWIASHGPREAVRRAAVSAGVFALVNLPLAAGDVEGWLRGVTTPLAEPMFARGAGLVFLSTNGVLPMLPASAYLAMELVAAAACLVTAWRLRQRSPELGVVLAVVPLYFAYRSLFSYFFLLPLFAMASLVRMRLPALTPGAAREAGAVTILVEPRRR
ncbi:MAG TPA: glycosyltransferase 87 family protein [Candidatus Limnocylindria bacterium]|nr:glycosyltransferase 87 family protein [Candidatus Limnocylindria bacterium]